MPENTERYQAELETAVTAALAGGRVVKTFFDSAGAATYAKGDGSPVTDADLAADRAIREILTSRAPYDAILTEEGQDDRMRLGCQRCWIVDPIDGTEQFIQRTGEFDVLVALVDQGRPVAVAGYQPTTGVLVTATLGGGAWVQVGNSPRERIAIPPATTPPRLATSKWFGAPENEPILRRVSERLEASPAPSMVTGFTPRMFLAPRAFDVMIGVRPGQEQTMASEWDFAVTDLVVHESGGTVTDLAGNRFQYNKDVPKNFGGLIAAVDPATHTRVADALRATITHSESHSVK